MKPTSLRARALACALLAGTAYGALSARPAAAQASAAPAHRTLDSNGVDLTHGGFHLNFLEGSIGSGDAELALFRRPLGRSQWEGIELERSTSGSSVTIWVKIGMDSEKFTGTISSLTSTEAGGGTLAPGGGGYIYTGRDGTRIVFFDPTGHQNGGETNLCHIDQPQANCRLIPDSIISPDGKQISFTWTLAQRCANELVGTTLDCQFFWRLERVANSFGQQLAFSYAAADGGGALGQAPAAAWSQRTRSDFVNAVAGPTPLAAITYEYPAPGVTDMTDMGGRTWRFTADPTTGILTGIRRPGAASDSTTIAYGPGPMIVTRDGVATQYSRIVSQSGPTATMTVTQLVPGGTSPVTTIVSDLELGRPTSVTDPLTRTTSFQYHASGQLKRVTRPEGNYVEHLYDARGNITQTIAVAKGGAGAAMVVSADYDPACANPVTCNRPARTTDARGQITDYEYDPDHGGLVKVTRPAPTPGAVRPQIRYGYTLADGEYRLTSVSHCRTMASCAGTADEVRTIIAYYSDGTVASSSSGDGTGALTATRTMSYDAMGNLRAVDGPLAGAGDSIRYHYNAAREPVGIVSPDPDGPGAGLKPRAVRNVIDPSTGLLSRTETGNVDSPSDSDWATFAPAQAVEYDYEHARPVEQRLTASGAIHALTRIRYDSLGRAECVAQRMNKTIFATVAADACELAAQGTGADDHGPDRIARTIYDLAGQVTRVRTALGTADEADEVATTYTANGLVQTVRDGENNLTSYEYDGHDRLSKTYYPLPSPRGAGASNAADYEQTTYEVTAGGARTSGLVAAFRNRAGDTIGFGHDALGRMTHKDRPGAEPDSTYGYDLPGQLISASQPGQALGFTYDALGRVLTETGALGAMTSEYDLAGRRTRLTWPDGFFVTYDHLVTGEVTAIRENGAASGIGVIASLAYDNLGRRTSLTLGNGLATHYRFDPASRLDELKLELPGTSNDLISGFAYNPAGQIASTTRSNPGSGPGQADLYAWTGHGSGTTIATSNGIAQSANGLNQIGSWGNALGYDAKGNIVSDGAYTYTYSSENLLTSLTNPTPGAIQSSSTYAYDPLMRLAVIDSSNPALDVRFGYDGQEMAYEALSNNRTRRYVHGPGIDEPLVGYLVTPTGTSRLWYQADERGSITRLSNDAGTPSSIGKYDEYGTGGTSRFRYTGQYWLGDANLLYYRARIYDPWLGRFLQPDPIGYGGGMNLYAYVGGDPVNFTDPSGMCRFTLWGYFRHNSDWSEWELLSTSVTQDSGCGSAWMTDYFSSNFSANFDTGGSQAEADCDPAPGKPYADARTATILGARATAIRNNQNSGSGSLQEFHANIKKVSGGYAFTLNPGPKGGGSVPFVLNPKGSYGSAHNHEHDSNPGYEGYLSNPGHNREGFFERDSDVGAYQSFFRQAEGANPSIRNQLHIALAIGAKGGHIYYWKPGSNLASKGKDVGPTFCGGGK